MNTEIITFAIAHNQDLILEKNQHYIENCENLNWLLVGTNREIDKLKERKDIKWIHCEKLPNNIEEKSNLLHYTAYYAVLENDLLPKNNQYIRFIEYDLNFKKEYQNNCQVKLQTKQHIYCHLEASYSTCWKKPYYLNELNERCLKEKFRTDLTGITKHSKSSRWMVSINFIFTIHYFKHFMDFSKLFVEEYYKDERQAGNNLERLFTIFNLRNGYSWSVIPGATHLFKNSHGTS